MATGAQVTAHFRRLRSGQKGGYLNLELTRRQAEEWINVLSVGLVEERSHLLHFVIREDQWRDECRRGSCEGKAQGGFSFVRRR